MFPSLPAANPYPRLFYEGGTFTVCCCVCVCLQLSHCMCGPMRMYAGYWWARWCTKRQLVVMPASHCSHRCIDSCCRCGTGAPKCTARDRLPSTPQKVLRWFVFHQLRVVLSCSNEASGHSIGQHQAQRSNLPRQSNRMRILTDVWLTGETRCAHLPVAVADTKACALLCALMQLYEAHRSAALHKAVLEFYHISKAGGTSFCQASGRCTGYMHPQFTLDQ